MDGDPQRRTKKSYFPGKKSQPYNSPHSTSPEYDRRPLRAMSLTPPDYQIDLQRLLEDYVEKDVRYAGPVSDVSVDVDVTNRTDILKLIDRGKSSTTVVRLHIGRKYDPPYDGAVYVGEYARYSPKKQGKIPWHTTFEQDAIFSLCAHNIKISRRHGEDLLLRVPIHEIAAICYIRDDGQHILALKHGDPDFSKESMCSLAVLYCDSKNSAEEICALVGQCFQLVYTDATMQFFDQEVRLASGTSTVDSSTTQSDSSTITKQGYDPYNPSFLTRSNPDLRSNQSSTMSRTIPRSHRTPSTASELSAPSTELLQDYLRKLHTKLTSEELKQFAMLLKARRTNLPFNEFCDKVLSLFGSSRKHLMAGMWPFIGERDYSNFEEFLEQHSIGGMENGRGTLSGYGYPIPYVRTTSESSAVGAGMNGADSPAMSGEEFERYMDHIQEFEKENALERPTSMAEPLYMSVT